ncbi:MAG: hypothetical protein E7363_02585 [Clostridiales bacterium]|nr:hypothetical protein [Clostridiales bacterium]
MSVGISSLARAGKGPATVKLPETSVIKVPVSVILDTPKGFQKDTRASAEAQVKAYGVTEPVVAWAKGSELFLLRGANTLQAAKALSINEVPAVILSLDETAAKAFCKQMNAIPKAEKAAPVPSIHEEKFRAVKSVKTDLPYYLL